MGKSNTAKIRGYNRTIGEVAGSSARLTKDQSEYLDHNNSSMQDAKLIVKATTENFIYDKSESFGPNPKKRVCDAFYCSEYDVQQLEKCSDYSEFLIDQLALTEYYECLQLLYYVGISQRARLRDLSIWIEENKDISIKECVDRYCLGILVENDGIKTINEISLNDLSDLIRIIADDTKRSEDRISAIHELQDVLQGEIKSLTIYNWFSRGILGRYEQTSKSIHNINSSIQQGESVAHFDLEVLKDFNNLRGQLIAKKQYISDLLNGNSDIEKYSTVEKVLIQYVNTRSSMSEYHDKSQELQKFKASDQRVLWNDYLDLVHYLEDGLRNIIGIWKNKIGETLQTLLSDYFIIDNDEILPKFEIADNLELEDLDITPGKETFEEGVIRKFLKFDISIKTCRGKLYGTNKMEVEPRSYMNTFKYKLFCVALKMAFVCMAKKVYQINYPVIIDDVFDSSDFDSRIKLRDFIKEMLLQHYRLLPEPKYKLQFIFFTQDDLIADQVGKGLQAAENDSKVMSARIYDYHEADAKDIMKFEYINNSGSIRTCNYINLGDEFFVGA